MVLSCCYHPLYRVLTVLVLQVSQQPHSTDLQVFQKPFTSDGSVIHTAKASNESLYKGKEGPVK